MRRACDTVVSLPGAMENLFFFPQAALDQWIVDERVDFKDGELTVLGPGRRYRLSEAVHVLREVTGTPDGHDLIGRVKARGALDKLGAEIVETSMLLGDAAYDVEPGWVGAPVGTNASAASAAQSDEEILTLLARGPGA
jgi:hypothetical protein